MNTTTITRGAWVCVNLRDHCDHERPHRPAEDGRRGQVTDTNGAGDHPLFVLYRGIERSSRFPDTPDPYGFGRLPLGRHYSPDELEIIPEPP